MTNKSKILVASLLFLTLSCTENEDASLESNMKKISLGVSSETNADTRLIAYKDGSSYYNVRWQSTDKINVFPTGGSSPYEFDYEDINPEHNEQAYFTGTIDITKKVYYVMYPAQNTTMNESDEIYATIPSVQYGYRNSFDPAAALQFIKLSIGTINNSYDVALKNVCAFFQINIGHGITKVVIETPDGNTNPWYFSGRIKVKDINSQGASITFDGIETNQNSLTPSEVSNDNYKNGYVVLLPNANDCDTADGYNTFKKGSYLIAFAPSSGFHGIKVTAYKSTGTYVTHASSETKELSSGKYYSLGTWGSLANGETIDGECNH